jgi:hypothetical protein
VVPPDAVGRWRARPDQPSESPGRPGSSGGSCTFGRPGTGTGTWIGGGVVVVLGAVVRSASLERVVVGSVVVVVVSDVERRVEGVEVLVVVVAVDGAAVTVLWVSLEEQAAEGSGPSSSELALPHGAEDFSNAVARSRSWAISFCDDSAC